MGNERCNNDWSSKSDSPKRCGRCKSPYWDRERRARVSGDGHVETGETRRRTDPVTDILIKVIEDVRADRAGFGIQWRELVALDNRTKEVRRTIARETLVYLDTLFEQRAFSEYRVLFETFREHLSGIMSGGNES